MSACQFCVCEDAPPRSVTPPQPGRRLDTVITAETGGVKGEQWEKRASQCNTSLRMFTLLMQCIYYSLKGVL